MINKIRSNKDGGIYIELYIKPIWDHIASIRNFVENYLRLNFTEDDKIYEISFSVSELLENAVKYSDGGNIMFKIETCADDFISIYVENNAKPEHIETITEEVNELEGLTQENAYEKKLMTAREKDGETGGLGLSMMKERTGGEFFLDTSNNMVKMQYLFKFKIN